MKKHLIICLLFLYLHQPSVLGQGDSLIYYFDESLGICDAKNAIIIGIGSQQKGKFLFNTFYAKSKLPLFNGSFTDSTLAQKDGYFTYYDNLGYKESEGFFKKNIETGYWQIWEHNQLSDSIFYEKGEKVEHILFTYSVPTGKLIKRFFMGRDNYTETTEWFESGGVKSKITTNGSLGEETKYYLNGNIESITHFKSGKLQKVRSFREDGSEIVKENNAKKNKLEETNAQFQGSMPPTYPGGTTGFMSFFQRNFKSPPSLQNTGQTVTITFFLDKAGFAYDIKVSGSTDRDVEIEVMTVFRRMSAWIMNGYQSYGPVTYNIVL